MEVVLVDEVLQDVGELDPDVLGVVDWGREVVVGDVLGDELGPFARDDAVEDDFAEIKRGGFSSSIACAYTVFTHDGDARVVRVVLFGEEFINY